MPEDLDAYISFYLSTKLDKAIKREAKKQGRAVGNYVRYVIDNHIEVINATGKDQAAKLRRMAKDK